MIQENVYIKCVAILLLVTASFSCRNDETDDDAVFFYQLSENSEYTKVQLKVRKDKLIVQCDSEENAKALAEQDIFTSAYYVGYVIATVNPKKTSLKDVQKKMEVISATYGLEDSAGDILYPKNNIFVIFKEGKTPEENLSPEEILEKTGLTERVASIKLYDEYNKGYDISLNVALGDILSICSMLIQSGWYTCAEPTFIREMKQY